MEQYKRDRAPREKLFEFGRCVAPRHRSPNAIDVYWQPWSEWWITALAGRCPSAMLSASSTRLGAQASRIRCWTSPMERLDSFARSRSTFPGPSANAEKNDDADFAVKFDLPRAGQFCGRRRSQAGSPPSQVRPSPTKSGQVRLFGRAHSATRSALSQHSSETGSLRTPPTAKQSGQSRQGGDEGGFAPSFRGFAGVGAPRDARDVRIAPHYRSRSRLSISGGSGCADGFLVGVPFTLQWTKAHLGQF